MAARQKKYERGWASYERDRAWRERNWDAWRKQDFTWDGLTKHPWKGWVVTDDDCVVVAETGRRYGGPDPGSPARVPSVRAATLQDYWRADPECGRLRADEEMADELVTFRDQPIYHRAHLPFAYEDGSLTGKGDWATDSLDTLVTTRLRAAFETQWYQDKIVGPDARAQLLGGVWLCAPALREDSETPFSLRYEFARFSGNADFSKAAFSDNADFSGAAFFGDADFSKAAFSDNADFSGTTFFWRTNFSVVAFSDNADFSGAAFSGTADFSGAAFSGNADFRKAAFNYADFRMVTFSRDANFGAADFTGDASFSGVAFTGYTYFSGAAFSGDANFSGVAFSGDAYFREAAFYGIANFSGAAFSGDTNFSEAAFSRDANFSGVAISGDAYFREAAFSGDANFSEAAFSRDANFSVVAFSSIANFGEVTFSATAHFSAAAFSGNANFSGVAFSGTVDFSEAAFSGDADFSEAALSGDANFRSRAPLLVNPEVRQPVVMRPETGDAPGWAGSITTAADMTVLARRCFGELNLSGAVFAGDVDFSDREFLKKTSFQGARFHGLTLFHGCQLHQDTSFLNARFGDRSKGDAVAKRAGGVSGFLRGARLAIVGTGPGASLPRVPPDALARLYLADERLFDVRQELKATADGLDTPKTADERRAALNAVLPFAEWEAAFRAKWAETAQDWFKRPDADTRFKAMESAFRTLKLAMETNRDRAEEGRFFRLELLAKRQRRDDQVPLWERVTSRLYGALADYGDSITRPLGWLFSLLVVMGAAYWGIGAQLNSSADIFVPDPPSAQDCLRPVKVDEYCKKYNIVRAQIGTIDTRTLKDGRVWSPHDMWSAMTFSWNNVFRPFSALSAEAVGPYEPSWASAVLYGYGPGYGLAVRMLASVQSLVSILLVFLFALAMRRRFQIS